MILLALLGASQISYGESWELRYDEGGIKAFVSETVDSNFLTIKITSVEVTTLDALVALHKDIPHFPEWGSDLKSASVVSSGEKDYVLHFKYHAPWPVQDRDIVFRTLITQPNLNAIRLDYHTVDSEPPTVGYQRVAEAYGYWLFTARPDDKVAIEYLAYSDPDGFLPAFLVNTKSLEILLVTYKSMLRELKTEPYKSALVPFITHPSQ